MKYLVFFAILLSGCIGYDDPELDRISYGVTVTKEVPFSQESIQDIIDRGDPATQDDRVAPDHHIDR